MTMMYVEDIFSFTEETIKNFLSVENIKKINKYFGGIKEFLQAYLESANLSGTLLFLDPNAWVEEISPNLTKNIRVIVKRVGEPPKIVELKEYPEVIDLTESLLSGGYITRINLFDNIVCWINKKAKSDNLPMNFPINGQIIAGDVVFTNVDNYIVGLSDKQLNKIIDFFSTIGHDYSKFDYKAIGTVELNF